VGGKDDGGSAPQATEPEFRLPDLGAPVADTHAHLDMLDDPAGAIARATAAGVGFVVTIADLTEEPERTFEGLGAWTEAARSVLAASGDEAPAEVGIIVGVHPHNAARYDDRVEAELMLRAVDPRVRAIGEVGLDFHYDHSPRDDQRRAMRRHLAVAHETGLPVCIHLREAHEEGLAILREAGVPTAGCIIHCFTEGPEWAQRFLDIGCHIAFGGVVTFGKADAVREAARVVPLERLLLETDCPFLAPVPYRGRTNEPALVTLVAAKVAEVKGLDPSTLARATYANSLRLLASRPAAVDGSA
jgi:TatD DNase family protein